MFPRTSESHLPSIKKGKAEETGQETLLLSVENKGHCFGKYSEKKLEAASEVPVLRKLRSPTTTGGKNLVIWVGAFP